ncbi:MAG TPA: GMC family oxidoreductase [Myxococcales bacterium]|nr:GMC family oxidoreductase [Myxococcales bacterium]
MALPQVEICIVGSGAGGAPMALELGKAGFQVVVLEKGPDYKLTDYVHDEILNSRRDFFQPFPWDEPHLIRYHKQDEYERSNAGWLASCVGGGTVHMSGLFYRMKPIDFRLKSELGGLPGANIVDWPISYEELSPYYDRAEEELGVSGVATPHPFAEPRRKPFPLPPTDEHPMAKEIDRVAATLGYHTFPTARGIVSRPYHGRPACTYCAMCGSYGCEVGAKGVQTSIIAGARATGHVEIRPHCMARSIEVDGKGRAKSVVYEGADGKIVEQPAKLVIVSCTAIESARLLLNSKSSRFPNGLANGNGQVGRNLVFSSFGKSHAHFRIKARKASWPWLADRAPFVNRSLQDFYVAPPEAKLPYRKAGTLGYLWTHPNPIFAAIDMAGDGKHRMFGKMLKDKLREYGDTKILEYEIYAEFLPTDGTKVEVDPATHDKYGLPAAKISIDRHPADLAAIEYLMDKGDALLKAMKPDHFFRHTVRGTTTILQGGTCRMGKDPATSVLDKDCRSHEVDNLYVVDGSFLPSSGGIPLTLTIVANSFRVADALVRKLKRT